MKSPLESRSRPEERNTAMSPTTLTLMANAKSGWTLSVSGAVRAAERALRAANVASDWAARSGAGQVEAAECRAAAEAAMAAANLTAAATTLDDIREHAVSAWEAADEALAADKRMTASIAAKMWATEARKARGSETAAA